MSERTPGRTTTVLVHEWVTGGGLAGSPLPASWAREGTAMRTAIARDFAALPGFQTIITLDDRLAEAPGPYTTVRIGPGDELPRFLELANTVDYIVTIAPESGGVLLERAGALVQAKGRSLGSLPEGVRLTSDKLALAAHLSQAGVAVPAAIRIGTGTELPASFAYPAVLKPIDGAGCLDTVLVSGANDRPPWPVGSAEAMLQEYVPGIPMSASYLVDRSGRAHLVAAGRQRIAIENATFHYQGGILPIPRHLADDAPRRAVESVPGLRGFVGVDFVWSEATQSAVVLEINPRPTTSYTALARLLPPGRLAAAWIDAVENSVHESLADTLENVPPVLFHPDGTFDGD